MGLTDCTMYVAMTLLAFWPPVCDTDTTPDLRTPQPSWSQDVLGLPAGNWTTDSVPESTTGPPDVEPNTGYPKVASITSSVDESDSGFNAETNITSGTTVPSHFMSSYSLPLQTITGFRTTGYNRFQDPTPDSAGTTSSLPMPYTGLYGTRASAAPESTWPIKMASEVPGDLIIGGLMMVHEREDTITCGPVMPQGGIQALETMLFTLDIINNRDQRPFSIGAHILDDCDKDTYGLEMAVDFIKEPV